jgi:hypothetical protein
MTKYTRHTHAHPGARDRGRTGSARQTLRASGWTLSALAGALRRALLGKASDEHMQQFTGSDAWWARVNAARDALHRGTPVAYSRRS